MSRKFKFHNKEVLCHHNKPIELWSMEIISQKLNYIHQNPLKAGFVRAAAHWKYSSADNYSGGLGVIDVLKLY